MPLGLNIVSVPAWQTTFVTRLYDSDVLIKTTACSSCFVHFQTLTRESYSTYKPNVKLSKVRNKKFMINWSRFGEMKS